jgi:A/G-specific adenine glycosylase
VSRIRVRLLAWYSVHQRDLPWRRTRDPYAIWISESMLQQTRVETVIPYYRRFLERFPRVEDLARSELEEVLRIWTGLGYYSRARNLHKAAQRIVDAHGAALPKDPEALRSLPGVGRYTAGAVASIAFDRPEPIVDGNVARVLARLFAIETEIGSSDATAQLWSLAARLADGPEPGHLNQALMELGATLCTPRAPRCVACPVKRSCRAERSGDPEGLPRKRPKARPRPVQAVAGWLARRGALLVVQRPANGLLGGLWELPGGDLAAGEPPGAAIIRVLRERVGLAVSDATALGSVEHTFTHLALRLHVFRCADPKGRVRLHGPAAHRWVAPTCFERLPHAAATRKAMALLRSSEAGA